MNISSFTDGVYLIDFEFHPLNCREGNPPVPLCMLVREWPSGSTSRYWISDLAGMPCAPFPTGEKALWVAYFASAEMDCFQALGWIRPVNLLDLFAEFRCLTNGVQLPHGNGLIGALLFYGIPSITGEQKEAMRDLILSAGPWNLEQQGQIMDYCETDVMALSHLLVAMLKEIDWPRALLRGRYMKAVSCMQMNGIPLDLEIYSLLLANWHEIQDDLIAEIDSEYGVYEGRSFKTARWEQYLVAHEIPWPRLESGRLDMCEATFRSMARIYIEVAPMRELRSSLSEMRLANLQVGEDGRNRCLLSPFRSRTGRNQPSNSGDENMMDAYRTGDPYLAFAIQAGAAPTFATKQTHEAVREQFKACVLAVQYGMGEASLAGRINQPVARARQLLELHRRTYKKFWQWSDGAVDEAVLGGRLWAGFGWQIHTSEVINDRSLRNFPMQANGAEMLRIACILLTEAGIRVCAPVHDALLIEAPLERLGRDIEMTKAIMLEASRIVLDGFELGSDVKEVRYPERYMDKRGSVMWDKVMKLLGYDISATWRPKHHHPEAI